MLKDFPALLDLRDSPRNRIHEFRCTVTVEIVMEGWLAKCLPSGLE